MAVNSIYQQTHTSGLPSRYEAAQQQLTVSAVETAQLEVGAEEIRAEVELAGDVGAAWNHEMWQIEHERYRHLLNEVLTSEPGSPFNQAASSALERCEQEYSQGQKHWTPQRWSWERAYGMSAYEADAEAGVSVDYEAMAGTPPQREGVAARQVMQLER